MSLCQAPRIDRRGNFFVSHTHRLRLTAYATLPRFAFTTVVGAQERRYGLVKSIVTLEHTDLEGTLDLQISKPAALLNEIAQRYDSLERILMEYIDNPLDDVENLFRANGDYYPYEVYIQVTIDSYSRSVSIRDNCHGMLQTTLERIVVNVGESKKNSPWLNGQFGFGVHAFRAAAEQIIFRTKHADGEHLELCLHRDQHKGIRRPIRRTDAFPTDTGTGTEVIIGPFSQEAFETFSVQSIKREIELHFERLLARPNLKITVQEEGHEAVQCTAFDYDQIPGETFADKLDIEYDGQIYPVEVYLKVSSIEVPGRRARFFNRGRRINEMAEIKSFRRYSAHASSVWGHPHLIGYIDIADIVKPVITRDEFVRDARRRALYDTISTLESTLKEALTRVNEAHQVTTMHRLEDIMREALNKLAQEDRLTLRSELVPGNQHGAIVPGGGAEGGNDGGPTREASVTKGGRPGSGEDMDGGPEPTAPGSQQGETKSGHQIIDDPNKIEGSTRRRIGLDIKFADLPPDFEGRLSRSQLVDGVIYINTGHPDFQERIGYYQGGRRQGRPRFTDRLGFYLASTVSIHYKDEYYSRYGRQPEHRDQMFDEQVEFACRLEKILHPNLSRLEEGYAGNFEGGEIDDSAA